MERQLGPIEQAVGDARELQLQHWLGENVWPLGRSVTGEELVARVSGAPLSASPFLRYLEGKVDRLLKSP